MGYVPCLGCGQEEVDLWVDSLVSEGVQASLPLKASPALVFLAHYCVNAYSNLNIIIIFFVLNRLIFSQYSAAQLL